MNEEDKKTQEDPVNTEQEDLEAAGRSTADYANYEQPKKPRNPIWRKLIIGLVALVVIAALAAGAYWFIKNRKSTNEPAKNTESSQTENTAPATSQIATATKHYDSANFGLGLDHPEDWTVTDSGGLLTIKSPPINLKLAGGQQTTGQILLTIRAKDQKLSEFDDGNATAARQSVKIDYTKPTQSQRGSTYESFLAYSGSTDANTLDGIYITGDSGYTKGQAIPKVDILKVDPLVSISFVSCTENQCSGNSTPVGVEAGNWDDKNFSGPLEAMLKSLAIN